MLIYSKKLPPGCKNENRFSKAISRLRAAIVFLIADLESTSKVASIGMFLLSSSTFLGNYEPNHVSGRNHASLFANSMQRSGKK